MKDLFPDLFSIAEDRDASMGKYWNFCFVKGSPNCFELVGSLFELLYANYSLGVGEEDSWYLRLTGNGEI